MAAPALKSFPKKATVSARTTTDREGRATYLVRWGEMPQVCGQIWRGKLSDLLIRLTRADFDVQVMP